MPRWLSKNSKNNFFSPTFFFLISVFISNFASADNSLPVKRVTLSNQATLIHYVDPNLNTAAIDWFVRVGSLQEKSPQGSGVAHLTEHMIFKGAEGGTPGVLMREIESLGGDMNAATSNDYTHYYVEVPKAHYLKALELMSQVILNPAFRQDEFLKERDVVLRELDYRFSLPDYVAYEALFKESFTRHGYRIPPIGFKEKIQQISFNDFKSFYANNYAPENMFISIVGDVDSEKSQQIIKKAFQQRSFDSNYVKVPQPSELPILFQKKISLPWDFEASKLIYAFQTPGYGTRDLFALEILSMLLGQGRSSRLYQESVNEGNVTLSAGASHETFAEAGLFVVDATLIEKNKPIVEKIFNDEIKKLQTTLISAQELERARKVARQVFLAQKESPSSLAFSLCYFEAFLGGYSFLESFEDELAKVTAEDVRSAASRYLTLEHCVQLHAYPKTKDVSATVTLQKENEIKRTEVLPGITLLFKQDLRVQNAVITVLIKGGNSVENDQSAGLSNLISNLMIRRTQHHNTKSLQDEIESLGSTLDVACGNNVTSFSLTILKEDLGKALSILKEILQQPQWDNTDLTEQKKILLDSFDLEKDDAFRYASRLIRAQLFENHPFKYPTLGNRDIVERVTLEEVNQFYEHYVKTSPLVICVFGDVDQEAVINNVKTLFLPRHIEQSQPHASTFLPANHVEEESITDQAIVVVGTPGAIYPTADYYALLVWTEIFGGLDGALSMGLRNQTGWIYTAGANQMASLSPGYVVFFAGCEPSKTSQVLEKMNDTLINFQPYLTDDIISRAKQALLGQWVTSNDNKESLAYQTGLNEVLGVGYQEYLRFPDRINAVSQSDLQRVAKKYFHSNSHHVVILKPSTKNGS